MKTLENPCIIDKIEWSLNAVLKYILDQLSVTLDPSVPAKTASKFTVLFDINQLSSMTKQVFLMYKTPPWLSAKFNWNVHWVKLETTTVSE